MDGDSSDQKPQRLRRLEFYDGVLASTGRVVRLVVIMFGVAIAVGIAFSIPFVALAVVFNALHVQFGAVASLSSAGVSLVSVLSLAFGVRRRGNRRDDRDDDSASDDSE